MDSSEIFRQNLHRLAFAHQFDNFEKLAGALNFRTDDRKWLRRCWESGLKQPNSQTKKQLQALADLLRTPIERLWDKDIEFNPFAITNDRMNFGFLVSRVIEAYRYLQQAKLRRRQKIREGLALYGYNENLFIADWVAAQFGAERPYLNLSILDADKELASEADLAEAVLFGDLRLEETLELAEWVATRAHDHPRWTEFKSEVVDWISTDIGVSDEAMIEAHFRDYLGRIVDDLRLRIQSPSEILDAFVRFFLDEEEEKLQEQNCQKIIDELSLHPMWPEHVRQQFDSDEERAEQSISELWGQVLLKAAKDSIRPEQFVSFYHKILNDLNVNQDDANEIARSHRTKEVRPDKD